MARVKKEVLIKVEAYLDELDSSIENKCTLCNETLTHITNQCSAQTGAPKNTITNIITKRFNTTALPADKIGKSTLRNRVQQKEGIKRSKRAHKNDNSYNSIVLLQDFNTMLLTRQLAETKGDLFLANELVDLFEKRAEVKTVTPKVQDDIDKLKETCKKLRAKNSLLKEQVAELQHVLLEYDKKPVQQTNEDFVEEFKEERNERIKKMRALNGYNENGTPI